MIGDSEMKHIKPALLLLITGLLLSGCTMIPHDIELKPELSVEKQNIGNNRTLLVEVADGRDTEVIGYRSYMKTGKISLSDKQNIIDVIKNSVEDGFATLGFTVVQNGTSERLVEIDIRLVEYETTYGFFTMGSFSRGSFEVSCILPSGSRFKNLYRVENERRLFAAPFAKSNEKWINEAVSEALMRMFDDESFMEFLVSE